ERHLLAARPALLPERRIHAAARRARQRAGPRLHLRRRRLRSGPGLPGQAVPLRRAHAAAGPQPGRVADGQPDGARGLGRAGAGAGGAVCQGQGRAAAADRPDRLPAGHARRGDARSRDAAGHSADR
ncbi:MAG: D-alanine aminotransferase, partial [uncultured Ramlibacter sp.]